MGMGYAATSAYVIREYTFHDLAKEAYENFVGVIHNWDLDYRLIQEALESDRDDDWEEALQDALNDDVKPKIKEEVKNAYEALCLTFKLKTGLPINIAYHDSENEGCPRYDQVDGLFFTVHHDFLYEKTEALKKLEEIGHQPEESFFVVYG